MVATRMAQYLKRFMNVLYFICLLWMILSLGMAAMEITGLLPQINLDWEAWFGAGALPVIGGHFLIAAINYVIFGRATLWHSSKAANESD